MHRCRLGGPGGGELRAEETSLDGVGRRKGLVARLAPGPGACDLTLNCRYKRHVQSPILCLWLI